MQNPLIFDKFHIYIGFTCNEECTLYKMSNKIVFFFFFFVSWGMNKSLLEYWKNENNKITKWG